MQEAIVPERKIMELEGSYFVGEEVTGTKVEVWMENMMLTFRMADGSEVKMFVGELAELVRRVKESGRGDAVFHPFIVKHLGE